MDQDRLTIIEDKLAIRELRMRYCRYVDSEQWNVAANMFTEDGEFEGIEIAKGRAAIEDWFSRSVPETFTKAWHMCTNDTTYLDGHKATGTTAFSFYVIEKGVAKLGLGFYEDTLEKHDGEWLFRKRKVNFDFFVDWQEGFGGAIPSPEEFKS